MLLWQPHYNQYEKGSDIADLRKVLYQVWRRPTSKLDCFISIYLIKLNQCWLFIQPF